MRYARVTALYLDNGYPVCSIVDETSGAVFSGCRFMCMGGGTADAMNYSPPLPNSRVAYGTLAGNTQVVVMGQVFHQKNKRLTSDPQTVAYDERFPGQVSVLDSFTERGNAWFIMTADGQMVMDASQAETPVRIQLSQGSSGHLRLDQGGDADEHLLLAGPTRDYLDNLQQAISDVWSTLNKVILALPGVSLEAVSGAAAVESAKATASVALTSSTGADMVASAVRISSRSVLDDEV